MKELHVDIETYSSVDIKKSGAYKYASSADFEILCIAWSYGIDVEVCPWNLVPDYVLRDLQDPSVLKMAHNAAFERVCLAAAGLDTGFNWLCTAVLSGYNGLPLSLKDVSAALELGDKAKSSAGVALIRYFCVPVKATKNNGGRTRNLPKHDEEKWQQFMEYCRQDVVAESTIYETLKDTLLPAAEQRCYIVDQQVNDRGVRVDVPFIESILHLNSIEMERMEKRAKEITGLSNPNSPNQLKQWIKQRTGEDVKLTKDSIAEMHFDDEQVTELLSLRKQMSRTSIKKYNKMLDCAMEDDRIRGIHQFYGASKTGRWAGRLVQAQNLPRNYIYDLAVVREIAIRRDHDLLALLFVEVQDTLVQLVRTSFIPSEGVEQLTLCDYSAIEARVLAWLANEKWRMEIFNSKEKKDIYAESASRMFGIPMDKMDFHNRRKGKLAELVLGYQGGKNAVINMDAQDTGLTETEIEELVVTWRKANPAIVKFWHLMGDAAVQSIKHHKTVKAGKFTFETDDRRMTIQLPSGRKLCYWKAKLGVNRWGKESIHYMWADSTTKGKWMSVDTYGGKIVENITQAVARDFLSEALVRVSDKGYEIVMHIHDEIIVEGAYAKELEHLMTIRPTWAQDFPLRARAEEVKYFQK